MDNMQKAKNILDNFYSILNIEKSKFYADDIHFLNDGNMGSFSMLKNDKNENSYPELRCKYIDEDGVTIEITCNCDRSMFITSVDFWKYDFNCIVKFPNFEDIVDFDILNGSLM